MISNEGSTSNESGGVGPSLRNLIALALVALGSYQFGLGRGRSEKNAKEYAALNAHYSDLNAQYSDLKGEYDRAYAQYLAMKTQCGETNEQYSALKAQYDRLEAKRAK